MELTFEISLIELNKIDKYVDNNFPKNSNILDIKIGIYKIFKNLVTSLNTLDKLHKQNTETQSFATISRMIFDNYSVFYILSSYSTKEEQWLRYCLYLMDSLDGRINSITEFSESTKDNNLMKSLDDSKEIIKHDEKVISRILKFIYSKKLDNIVTEKEIKKRNWKFTPKLEKKERLSWEDLYNISRIPKRFSKLIQNHYSTYVHGLGMTILYEKRNESFIESTLLLLATIQLNIAKIIITELNLDKRKLKIDSDFSVLMESQWNNSERWNKQNDLQTKYIKHS